MNQDKYNKTIDAEHISVRNYLIGFSFAVLLTLISFGLVMLCDVSKQAIVIGLYLAAIAQIFVHLHFFLHLDGSLKQRWNLFAIASTVLLIFILAGGAIWVMYTLNSRMM